MKEVRTLGFVGLGVMGFPICRNIMRKSKLRMLAYDERPEPVDRIAALGGTPTPSLSKLGEAADLIFTCLPGEPELRAVVFGPGGLLGALRPGTTFVDLRTAPVDLARDIDATLSGRGVDFADAPIARTRQAAEDGTLSITVGASPEVFARIEPVLRHAATDVTHCGPVGCGQVLKLMNNMVLVETVIALSEARAIARRAGVDPAVLFDALSKGSADSFALRNHGMKAILPGAFPPRAFSTDYAIKDLSYALRLAEQVGVAADAAELARAKLQASREAGHAEAYWPAVSRIIDAE
jgi:3-hydroxyisobutyrate dehydrogenase-like beta-hydroxyacid dehydrogenase